MRQKQWKEQAGRRRIRFGSGVLFLILLLVFPVLAGAAQPELEEFEDLNGKTVGMLTGALFSLMKPHAAFINTGRGAQVDENGMIAALREVPTRVAVLDVTWPEPPAADSPLYTLPNVFLTPHIAGSIGNEVHRMAEFMAEECRRFDAGLPVRYRVTEAMLETMA